MLMPLGELHTNAFDQNGESIFRKGHDSGDDPVCPFKVTGADGPQQHPRLIRIKYGVRAPYGGSGHAAPTAIGSLKLVTMFWAWRISASESKKASVDSAPWF